MGLVWALGGAAMGAAMRHGSARNAIHKLQQFVVHALCILGAAFDGFRGAMAQMVPHQLFGNAPQRLLDRGNLGEDIRTVALLIDHALQTTHLPFDAPKPLQIACFHVGIMRHQANRTLRRRSELVTTLTELHAIAALARIGLNRMPNDGYRTPAATGMPITL